MTPERGFARCEFEARTARAQSLMAETGIDALLLTTEPEIRYFTGFVTRFWESPTRPWFLTVAATGEPVAVIPGIGADLMRATWIADIRTWPAPRPEDDRVSLLAATMAELLASRPRIGLPMGHETHLHTPLADFALLGELLPSMRTADAAPLIRTQHGVRSDSEIAKIAHARAIAGRAFAPLPEIAGPGRPLNVVFRDFQRLLLEEGAD